jgi:hypothetical protein
LAAARAGRYAEARFAGVFEREEAAHFEVRTYESYSEAKAQKKVDMFNNGEIEIMRDVQLGPIFFGQALIGSNLPHITYMLSGGDSRSAQATLRWI